MSLDRLPQELRDRRQWVVAGPDKKPRDPRRGQLASVTDPSTWGTFEEAAAYAAAHQLRVGFVFTSDDPYTGIDLDDKEEKPATEEQKERHAKIIEAFDSYTERSRSGRGYHVIVRGGVPAGVHRDNVEVYSAGHYFILTGDVVRDAPIADRQDLLNRLYSQMRPAETVELVEREEVTDDKDLIDMAMNAENAEKFNALCRGEWEALGYPSQSEADFALLSMLAFYSPNDDQVRRLFRMSALGKREKATRDDRYLDRSLQKIRASEPPRIDASALLPTHPIPLAPATHSPGNEPYERPPGLVGDLADYFYQNAIRQTFEAALVAAIGLVAGVAGRQFNTATGAGLNDYFLLLARTGTGKEAGRDGIAKIVQAVRPQVPAITDFIGPSVFASGQSIPKVLEKKPCCVCCLGEFGHTLEQITSPRAHGWEVLLRRMLLDVWSRSGRGKTLGETVYANEEKNIRDVESPSLTIVGDSTPETFYECLDESTITSGLLPRFLIVEYQGDRPPLNSGANREPPQDLADRVALLAATVLRLQTDNRYIEVPQDSDAQTALDSFNSEADDAIRGGSEVHRHVWNRAHLHALKVSTLLAVGDVLHNPIVREMHARWAIQFVRRSIRTTLQHFERGEVGGGSLSKAEARVRQLIENFLRMTPEQRTKDEKIPATMRAGAFIPYAYLREHTKRVQPFKGDKHALKHTLDEMVKDDDLQRVTLQDAREKLRSRGGEVYALGPNWK